MRRLEIQQKFTKKLYLNVIEVCDWTKILILIKIKNVQY